MSPLDRAKYLAATALMTCVCWMWLSDIGAQAQESTLSWQQEVRRCAHAKDWTAAMIIVDREIDRAPRDMDIRAWRARVLLWSGDLANAEREYLNILAAAPNEPDDWLGLANVYSRQGRRREAVDAVSHARVLDPKRADIRMANGLALQALGSRGEARLELRRALELDPASPDARLAVESLRSEATQELRVGVNTDLFDFADANHDAGFSLTSRWSPLSETTVSKLVCVCFGLRISECLALRWSDVDWLDGKLRVERGMSVSKWVRSKQSTLGGSWR